MESGELESEVVESGEQDKAEGEVSRSLNVTHIFLLLPLTEFPLLLMYQKFPIKQCKKET